MSNEVLPINAKGVALGSFYLTIQNIIVTFIGIIGYTFLVRSVTKVDVGAIAGLTLIASLLQVISDFGLNLSLARFVSELRGRGEDVSPYFRQALMFRVILSSLLCLSLLIFSSNISFLLFKTYSYSTSIELLSIDTFLISLVPLMNGMLLGAGMLREIASYSIISSIARWSVIVLFLLNSYGVNGVVLGWIAGDSISAILYSISIRKGGFLWSKRSKEKVRISEILRFSFPLYMSQLVSFLYSYYDRAIILLFLPLSDLGIYDIAYRIYSILIAFSAPVSSALFPYYGMAYGRNDSESISQAIKRGSKYSALIFSPLALGLFATSKPIIVLFAGSQYEAGYYVLSILSLFSLVYSISPALSNLLLIYGRTGKILLLNLASIAISIIFLPILIYLGLNGLATAKGLALLLGFILTVYTLSKIVRIRIDVLSFTRIITASLIMAIAAILPQLLYYNSFYLPIYLAIAAIAYIIALRLLRVLDEQDISLLTQTFGNRLGSLIRKIFYV